MSYEFCDIAIDIQMFIKKKEKKKEKIISKKQSENRVKHVRLITRMIRYRGTCLNIAFKRFFVSRTSYMSMRDITQQVFAMLWTWWSRRPRGPPPQIRTFSNYWGCSQAANGRVGNWQPLKHINHHKYHQHNVPLPLSVNLSNKHST